MIVFLLACVGAAHVVTESKIGFPVRAAGNLFGEVGAYLVTCPPCFAFWFAAFLCAAGGGPEQLTIFDGGRFTDLIAYCFAAVAINRILFGFAEQEE